MYQVGLYMLGGERSMNPAPTPDIQLIFQPQTYFYDSIYSIEDNSVSTETYVNVQMELKTYVHIILSNKIFCFNIENNGIGRCKTIVGYL